MNENYILYNILKNPFNCLIGCDAVTQIYQLQASFINDLNLLNITKIIDKKNYDFNYDLYKMLQEELISYLNLDEELKININNLFMEKRDLLYQ